MGVGVATVGDLAAIRLPGEARKQAESPGTFAGILGKTMSAEKSDGETRDSGKVQKNGPDAEDKGAKGKDGTTAVRKKSKRADDRQDGENTDSPALPDEAAAEAAAVSAVSTAASTVSDAVAAGAGNTASSVPAELPAAGAEAVAEGTVPAAPTAQQVVQNVLTELRRSGETIQKEQDALPTEIPKAQGQSAVSGKEETSAAVPAVPAVPVEKAAEESQPAPAAQEPEIGTLTATNTASAQNDSAQSGDSQEPQLAESTGKSEKLSRSSAEDLPAPTLFHTQMTAQTDRQTELQEVSAAVDQAIERFSTDFQGMETANSSIRIALEPKELGAMTITLAAGVNGVTAKIRTENSEVAALIGDQVQRMIQSMEAKGVHVESVNVVSSQTASQNFGSGGDNGAGQYSGSALRTASLFSQTQSDQADALSTYERTAGYYASEDGVGRSIEYRI